MNVKNHSLEVRCDYIDAIDVAEVLIHSIVFFRTCGKFTYRQEASYSVGTLGYEEVDCTRLNYTYVRCSSPTLINMIDSKLQGFSSKINDNSSSATLLLEFYFKRPNRWPFNDSKIVWESWNIKLVFNTPSAHQDTNAQTCGLRFDLENTLSQKLIDVVTIVNKEGHSLPQMPTQTNFENIFDSSFVDSQPYLFALSYKISDNIRKHTTKPCDQSKDMLEFSSAPRRSSLQKFLLETLEL